MGTYEESKPRNLVITKLKPQLYNLFHVLCEIDNITKEHLFESMLYDQCQRVVNERAKQFDVCPELLEAVEDGVFIQLYCTMLDTKTLRMYRKI